MNEEQTKYFAITVDDPGGLVRDLAILQKTLDFFAREEVPVTYFLVPQSGDERWSIDQDREWVEAIHQAGERGHDFQLHGHTHAHCEFGPNPALMSIMGGLDYTARLRADIEHCSHLWTRELFLKKLHTARSVFANAVGRQPLCFRSGALSQCPLLYETLPEVGLRYVSNRVIDPRGWHYIAGNYQVREDWDPDVPARPYYLTEEVIDLPIASEYAWQVPSDKVDKHVALAVEDMERVYCQGDVFLLVCHVQEVGGQAPQPQEVLTQILDTARRKHRAKFITVRELIAKIESGGVAVVRRIPRQSHGGYYNGS